MNTKQKAIEIANKFVTKSVFEMDNEQLKLERMVAKKHAITCVNEIIKVLQTTTGHWEQVENDVTFWESVWESKNQKQIENDFTFWESVRTEIEAL